MKKLLALVLALVMTLGLATVGTNAAFADQDAVDASEYWEAITVLNGMGVFQGFEDKEFKPDETITRAQVAAIIYRICTGDVDNESIANYVNLGNFSDVKPTDWYAGYVGYCANAKFIKGYGDGTFQPKREISGYEALAMILRAVGYNAQNDFEGAGYWVDVAKVAEQYKMLDNIKAEDLTGKAPRATIAEILFDAIKVSTVNWLPALGYQPRTATSIANNGNLNDTLGWKNFKLAVGYGERDEWGRPAKYWYKETNTAATSAADTANVAMSATEQSNAYVEIASTPLATYTEPTKNCDIYDVIKTTSVAAAQRYLNGSLAAAALATPDNQTNNGDTRQGRIVEFYKLNTGAIREVVIDTYLAQVLATVAEAKDTNGHTTRTAHNTLHVYDTANTRATSTVVNRYLLGNDYSAGDWLLVYVNTNTDNNVTIKGIATTSQRYAEVEPTKGTPDTVEAAQTKILVNQNKHEIGGDTKMDAAQFNLDVANTTLSYKMQWFFDQFGNVIGDADISRNDYAVLERIWYDTDGANESAQAVLRYFDGTTKTVTVNHMDGFTLTDGSRQPANDDSVWLGRFDDATIRLAEVTGANDGIGFLAANQGTGDTTWTRRGVATISSSAALNANAGFAGLALYRVWTYDNGSVDLEAFEQGTGVVDTRMNGLLGNNMLTTSSVINDMNRITGATAAVRTTPVNVLQQPTNDDTLNIKYSNYATVDATASAITIGAVADGTQTVLTHLNANTKFIYRTGTGTAADPFVYTTYTGTANLPAMVAQRAEVFYNGTANTVSSYVYVRNYMVGTAVDTRHVFIPANNSIAETTPGSGIWTIGAIVDGVSTTISGTRAEIVDRLGSNFNQGKMWHISFLAGVSGNRINAIDGLVNEASDEGATAHWRGPAADQPGACDYLAVDSTATTHLTTATYSGTTLIANTLTAGGLSYNLSGAKFFGEVSSLDEFAALFTNGTATTKGIWVVFNHVAGGVVNNATEVYVGTRLSRFTTLSATATNATVPAVTLNAAGNAIDGHTDAAAMPIAVNAGINTTTVTYTAATGADHVVTKIDAANNKNTARTLTPDDNTSTDNEAVEQVVVTAEDGWHTTTYTVTANFGGVLTHVEVSLNDVNFTEYYPATVTNDMVVDNDALGTAKTALTTAITANNEADIKAAKALIIRNALAQNTPLLIPTAATLPVSLRVTGAANTVVKVVSAAVGADAAATAQNVVNALYGTQGTNTTNIDTAKADNNTVTNGGVLVAEIKAPDGTYNYVAFRLAANQPNVLGTVTYDEVSNGFQVLPAPGFNGATTGIKVFYDQTKDAPNANEVALKLNGDTTAGTWPVKATIGGKEWSINWVTWFLPASIRRRPPSARSCTLPTTRSRPSTPPSRTTPSTRSMSTASCLSVTAAA